jgi:hypothetical protein
MRLGGEPDVGVEQAVEGFRAAGEFGEVAFERFGERIEEAPHIAGGELLIPGLTPFMEDQRDVPVGAHADIECTHHEIVGGAIIEIGELVAGDAAVLMVPALHQFTYGTLHELWQITQDEPGVFAGEFHLATKGEIVAAKDRGTGDDASGEGLVVTVAQAEHPAVILIGHTALDFHEAEVAHAVVSQAVGLCANGEAVAADGAFHMIHQFDVRDGSPAFGGARCGHVDNLMAFGSTSTAMQEEVGVMTVKRRSLRFEMSNHDGYSFR